MVAVLAVIGFVACGFGSQQGDKAQQATFKNVDAKAFADMIGKPNTVVIDVRTPEEVSQGYIKGATVFADINGSDFAEKINALDKSKTYLVYCRSGARSSNASGYMIKNGFTNVYNLNGGILGWPGNVVKP